MSTFGRMPFSLAKLRHRAADFAPQHADTNNIDRDYAALLILHHQKFVTLAHTELEFGRDDGPRKAANVIQQDHLREINQVHLWLQF